MEFAGVDPTIRFPIQLHFFTIGFIAIKRSV